MLLKAPDTSLLLQQYLMSDKCLGIPTDRLLIGGQYI